MPVSFEPAYGRSQFTAYGEGYRLALTPGNAALILNAPSGGRDTLSLRMVSANLFAEVSGVDLLPGKSFYLQSPSRAKWRTAVPQFAKVHYSAIYPGIDVIFYGNKSRLEYDFVVSPGASLKSVQLKVSGSAGLLLDPGGNLIVRTRSGVVMLQKPLTYQEQSGKRQFVACRFELHGNRIGFATGPYDHTRPLIVDPVLDYATYLSGAANERVNGIAVGSDGSTYVAGVSPSSDPAGHDDAFVAHVSMDGKSLLSKTFLGGSGRSEARGIALDPTGNILVVGTTSAADFPILNALQPFCEGTSGETCTSSAFLAKLNPDGSPNFATYFGGAGASEGNAVAADSVGEIYIAGTTAGTAFPVARPLQSTSGGGKDAFLAKISANGMQVGYATYLGGSGDDEALALAIGADGSAYLAGGTKSTNFPVRNAFQPQCRLNFSGVCQGEAFLAKVSPDGASLVYSTYFGGSGGDVANAIAVDAKSRPYLAGVSLSTDLPLAAALQSKPAGKSEAFVAQFLADGSGLGYSTYLGGTGDDFATSLAVDPEGYAFISGRTGSSDFPTFDPLQAACFQDSAGVCSHDAFITVLNPAGSKFIFSSYLGGEGLDQGSGIAIDASGSAYLGGSAGSKKSSSGKLIKTGSARILALGSATRLGSRNTGPAAASVGGMLVKLSGLRPQLNGSLACPVGSLMWTGAANDNLWTTASNWSGNAVPISTDNVCIPSAFAGGLITVSGLAPANQSIAGLVSNANIAISNGLLKITGPAQFANNLTVAAGATLILNGGNGSNVNGAMTLAGTLAGIDTLNIAGLLIWQDGGQMCTAADCQAAAAGQGVTNTNGIAGLANEFLKGRTLNNFGTATFSGNNSAFTLSYGAAVNNQAGAIWNLGVSSTVTSAVFPGSLPGTFNNAGLFENTGGSTGRVDVSFSNNGAVQVNAPKLQFHQIANGSGTWSVSTGNILEFALPGGVTVTLSGAISGAGSVQFVSHAGVINLTGTYNVTGGTSAVSSPGVTYFYGVTAATGPMVLDSGNFGFFGPIATHAIGALSLTMGSLNFSTGNPVTLTTVVLGSGIGGFSELAGTDTLNITGLLTWQSGGRICSDFGCGPSGVQSVVNANGGILGTSTFYLYNRTLNNAGTATFGGTAPLLTINLFNGAVINNLANATWNFAATYLVDGGAGSAAPAFNNAGLFTNGPGVTSQSIYVPFNNSGTVQSSSGSISFNARSANTGLVGSYTQTAGATILNGGSVNFVNSPAFIQGGSLTGSGTIAGSVVNSGGVFAPGFSAPTPLGGALTLTGSSTAYTQGPAAAYNVKIGGNGAGQFDTTSVFGAANINGTLNVTLINSFAPAIGNSYTILSANSISGVYSAANFPALPAGEGWRLTYNPNSVVLSVVSTNIATVPDTIGMTQAAATNAITGAGLTVGTVTQAFSPTTPSGRVISETPAPGTQIATGSAVNLVISSGPPPPPTADSVTPNAGAATSQTFTAVYSDAIGAGALKRRLFLVASSLNGAGACFVQVDQNGTYLVDDSGSSLLGPIPNGNSAANSQCMLNGPGTSVVNSGNSSTLILSITFKLAFIGLKSIFMYADDTNGNNSGFQTRGTFTVTSAPPTPVSVSPSSSAGSVGTFTAVYSDPAGVNALNRRLFLINSTLNGAGACFIQNDPTGTYLVNDTGSGLLGPITGSNTLSNSQCTLNGTGTGVVNSGNNSTLTLSIAFAPAFAGAKAIYMYTEDAGGNSGFQTRGAYSVTFGAPTADSVTPASNSGTAQIFTATYSDPAGAAQFNRRLFLINSILSGPSACFVQTDPTGIYLVNDAGSGLLGPITPGSTLSNAQCTLNGTGVINSGNSSTVTISLTFKPTFAGPKNIYLYAEDTNGNNSGFQLRGTYNVASTLPTADSVTPSSASGTTQIFTAVYSDASGATALNRRLFLISSALNGAGACFVQADPTGIYLVNDADTALLGPVTPGIGLFNSQCTLFGTGSSVVNSGNTSTVTLSIAFKPTYVGVKNIYMYVDDFSGNNSGFQTRGTYTVPASSLPTVVSVTPNSGTGATQTFTLIYSDAFGNSLLNRRLFLINSTLIGAGGCFVEVDPNGIFLANDADSALTGPLAANGTLTNSQCTINGTGSSVTNSATSTTIVLPIAFKPSFGGSRNLYMYADDTSGNNSGFQLMGTITTQ